jgi:hypothetical protein
MIGWTGTGPATTVVNCSRTAAQNLMIVAGADDVFGEILRKAPGGRKERGFKNKAQERAVTKQTPRWTETGLAWVRILLGRSSGTIMSASSGTIMSARLLQTRNLIESQGGRNCNDMRGGLAKFDHQFETFGSQCSTRSTTSQYYRRNLAM